MYYDGTKLMSLRDLKGEKPEVYLCTANRSAGKTTFFNRHAFNKFLENKEKFGLIYRYNYELDDVADKFFKDIQALFFNDFIMRSERKSNGIYHELFVKRKNDPDEYDGLSCGYAVTLNSADQIRRLSHLFSDTERMIFDEFQSESNHYCTNEITKFISVHNSIARGQGKQSRYVPVYMLSNTVSIINPYYTALGISERLKHDTKFLRGDGFVLEQGYVEGAANALKQSAFNRAFAKDDYLAYATENVYLNDNAAFIEKPKGRSRYLCTLRYKQNDYGIREFPDTGIIYCSNRADINNPNRISVTTDDHNINYVMLRSNQLFISNLRYFFEKGCFRFQDLRCKEALIKAVSY